MSDMKRLFGSMEKMALPIDDITPDPRNARIHPSENITAIARSMEEFGQTKPIIVSKETMTVIAGNGTLMAARQLGWKMIAANVVGLTDAQAKAYAIADNRTTDMSHFDYDQVGTILAELDGDLAAVTGFSEEEIDALIDQASKIETDDGSDNQNSDDLNDDPLVVPKRVDPGDVWKLGDHQLVCGDCRDWGDSYGMIEGIEGGVSAIITSPPYAQQRSYDDESGFEGIPVGDYVEWWDRVQENMKRSMRDDGSMFVNIKEHCEKGQRVLYVKDLTLAHVRRWGWNFVDEFVWTHGGTPKAPLQRFKNAWEPIFQFAKGRHKFRPDAVRHESDNVPDWEGLHPNMEDVQKHGCTEGMRRKGVDSRGTLRRGANFADVQGQGYDNGGIPTSKKMRKQRRKQKLPPSAGNVSASQGQSTRDHRQQMDESIIARCDGMAYPSNVLRVGKNRDAIGHPAMFPIELPEFFIKAFSDEGDAILDPFMGGGSTLIASEKTGRTCYGIEMSPTYCDIIIARWERLTGGEAVKANG